LLICLPYILTVVHVDDSAVRLLGTD